jgi:ParB-like chromosome segregation protein Spo0J
LFADLTTKPPDLPVRRKAKTLVTQTWKSRYSRKSVKMSLKHEIKKAKETSLSSIFQGAVSAMQRECVLIKKNGKSPVCSNSQTEVEVRKG